MLMQMSKWKVSVANFYFFTNFNNCDSLDVDLLFCRDFFVHMRVVYFAQVTLSFFFCVFQLTDGGFNLENWHKFWHLLRYASSSERRCFATAPTKKLWPLRPLKWSYIRMIHIFKKVVTSDERYNVFSIVWKILYIRVIFNYFWAKCLFSTFNFKKCKLLLWIPKILYTLQNTQ